MYTYEHPRPMVTVDLVVFGTAPGEPDQVLLIQRGHPPFQGRWAIPGGFLEIDEDLAAGARRELEEETGVTGVSPVKLSFYGKPGRDPRGRVISCVFVASLERASVHPAAGDDAAATRWFPLDDIPWAALAFDHAAILRDAIDFRRQPKDQPCESA